MNAYNNLRGMLSRCKIADRSDFERRIDTLEKSASTQEISDLIDDLERSCDWVFRRQKLLSNVRYKYDDIFFELKSFDILIAIERFQVILLPEETKPETVFRLINLYLYLGYGCRGLIGHTALCGNNDGSVITSIEKFIPKKLHECIVHANHAQVFLDDRALVKAMTNEVLLDHILDDYLLEQFEVIIMDDINAQKLIEHLKSVLSVRSDLKLIVISIGTDAVHISKSFENIIVL